MQIPFFDYQRQLKTIRTEIDTAIKSVLDSGHLILGNYVETFEKGFASYIGVDYGIGVNSGTDALKIALKTLDIKAGDEVITVANAGVPPVSAIGELGAVPVFVDILPSSFNMDENLLETRITQKTKAIVVVHLYGQAASILKIIEIAKKYKLYVIEDCAQAHGTKVAGRFVGSFGDLACFSFYPTKNLGGYGDAGLIVTNHPDLADKCRRLRMYGWKTRYLSDIEGFNSRLDELQAAILLVKLSKLPIWNKKRQAIAKKYLQGINNPKIILPQITNWESHTFHLFVVKVPQQRDQFIKHLTTNGIGAGIHYPYPVHLQPAYQNLGYNLGDLPITEQTSQQIVSIPIFPEITSQEVGYITRTINQFC